MALVALHAGAASADTLSLELSRTPAGDRSLLIAGADARGDGTFRARAGFDFSSKPLRLLTPAQETYDVVARQIWLQLGGSLALADRFLFALDVPLLLEQSAGPRPAFVSAPPTATSGAALGDPRLLARARLLGAADANEQLAFGVELFLPLGSGEYAGDEAARLRPIVTASSTGSRARVGIELGYLFRRSQLLPAILPYRTGSALSAGVAAAVMIDRRGELEAGPELSALLGTSRGTKLFDVRSTLVQALISARYAPRQWPWVFALGAGPGFGQASGSADFHALASVSFSPEQPPPAPDSDGDRVPDTHDACPTVRGTASDDPLMNGCPELPTDTDGDAIPDMLDACPKQAGPANVERRRHGCPKAPDGDADGVDDPIDACPTERGEPDRDPRRHGCPRAKAQLVARVIEISEQVQFETGTAALKAESAGILEQIQRVLVEHPELELVEIQGHTDDTGSAELNRSLSDERARSVSSWLVEHGIAPARLVAKGYGQDRPIAENTSETGRAKNRRVEFHVLRSAAAGAAP